MKPLCMGNHFYIRLRKIQILSKIGLMCKQRQKNLLLCIAPNQASYDNALSFLSFVKQRKNSKLKNTYYIPLFQLMLYAEICGKCDIFDDKRIAINLPIEILSINSHSVNLELKQNSNRSAEEEKNCLKKTRQIYRNKKTNIAKVMFKIMVVKYIHMSTRILYVAIFCEFDLIFITLCLSNAIVMMLSTNCEHIEIFK